MVLAHKPLLGMGSTSAACPPPDEVTANPSVERCCDIIKASKQTFTMVRKEIGFPWRGVQYSENRMR